MCSSIELSGTEVAKCSNQDIVQVLCRLQRWVRRKIHAIFLSGEIFENGIAPNFGKRKTTRQNTRSLSRRVSFESRATRVLRPRSYFSPKLETTRCLKTELTTKRCYVCFFLIAVVSTSEMGATVTTPNKRDWAVKDLPFPILNKTCVSLNIKRPFFDDFRMVAEKLGMDKNTIEWIGQSENPTHKMFTACHRGTKVGRLIEILHEIERPDVAKVLEDWVAEPWTVVMITSSSLWLLRTKFQKFLCNSAAQRRK